MDEFIIKENVEAFDINDWEKSYNKGENNNFTSSEALENIEIKQGLSLYSRLMLVGATTVMICGADASANDQIKYVESDSEVNIIETYSRLVANPFSNFMYELEEYIPKLENKKSEIIKQILSFKSLIQSWDGYGAYPLEIESAANALELVQAFSTKSVSKITELFPTPNGTVSFMWENHSDERISLEIGNKDYSFYVEYNSQSPIFFNGEKIEEKTLGELEKFIESL